MELIDAMSLRLLLCGLLFLVLGSAGPAQSDHPDPRNSDYLDHIPACALQCVLNFAAFSFPGCHVGDLDCQCWDWSRSGFTIGEGVLRCLISSCPQPVAIANQNDYFMCISVPGAQPATHLTITATTFNPTATVAAATGSMTTTTHKRTTTSHHTSHSTFSTRTTSHSQSTLSSAPTSAVTNEPQSAAAANPTIAPLNKAQVAGIIVSSLVIAAILFGLLACVFLSRRKRRRRDSDASFGHGAKSTASASKTPHLESCEDGSPPKESSWKHRTFGIPANPAQKRWTLWRMAMKKYKAPEAPSTSECYGRRSMTQDMSPNSVKSYQTISGLLPEKPGLKPSPPLPTHYTGWAPSSAIPGRKPLHNEGAGVRAVTPSPPGSQSSPQGWKDNNTSQPALQQQKLRLEPSDPFIDQSFILGGAAFAARPDRASNKDLPKLQTPHSTPKATAAYDSGNLPLRSYPSQANLMTKPQQLDTAHQPPQSTAHDEMAAETKFSKWKAMRPSNQGNSRRLTNLTNGSDTSFEDDDRHLAPPTAEASVDLSPVAESPAARMQNTGRQFYYPPVPAGAAMAAVAKQPHQGPQPAHRRDPPPPRAPYPQWHQDQDSSRLGPPAQRNYGRPRLASVKAMNSRPYANAVAGQPPRMLPYSPIAPSPVARYPAPTDTARPELGSGWEYRPPAGGSANGRYPRPIDGNMARYPPATNNRLMPRYPPPKTKVAATAELPDSSVSQREHRLPPSPGSPNFSRPQPPAQVYRNASTAKFKIESSPGPHGECETWGSPIDEAAPRGRMRPAVANAPPPQMPPSMRPARGPWRGREPPIGSQWVQ